MSENTILRIPCNLTMDSIRDMETRPPLGVYELIKALDVFGILSRNQVKFYLVNLGVSENEIFNIINYGKHKRLLYSVNQFIYLPRDKDKEKRANTLFWLFVRFSKLIKNEYSAAQYPSTAIYTATNSNNKTVSIEFVDIRFNTNSILAHLENRKKPTVPTSYIMLINSRSDHAKLLALKNDLFPSLKCKCGLYNMNENGKIELYEL